MAITTKKKKTHVFHHSVRVSTQEALDPCSYKIQTLSGIGTKGLRRNLEIYIAPPLLFAFAGEMEIHCEKRRIKTL